MGVECEGEEKDAEIFQGERKVGDEEASGILINTESGRSHAVDLTPRLMGLPSI